MYGGLFEILSPRQMPLELTILSEPNLLPQTMIHTVYMGTNDVACDITVGSYFNNFAPRSHTLITAGAS